MARSSGQLRARRPRCPLSASTFAPAGRWAGISSARLVCALRVSARRGRCGALAWRRDCRFPGLAPTLPWAAPRTRCACEGSFWNRLWGDAFVGSRGFPDFYPRPVRDHMPPPPLPPRCQKPAFCLSAVKWRVFIDATAILRCARFQLLIRVAPYKTRCLRAMAQLHVCCGDPHGKSLQASLLGWNFGIRAQQTHANSDNP